MLWGSGPAVRPGKFELYCGPMKSGKTLELLHRVERLNYLPNCSFAFFRPTTDTRDPVVKSRWGVDRSYESIAIDPQHPEQILEHSTYLSLVAIDETQFFGDAIVDVILELMRRNINVIASGLDLDFRGEPFGHMHRLLSIATDVTKLSGVCQVDGCGKEATRTQRLVNSKPAPYDSPIILVGDEEEGYECRCLFHHLVPSHPQSTLFEHLPAVEK